MDRWSLTTLSRQPGYPAFLGAATLARVADEMFSVGVVLFVLERTGSAALAGATVAAVTLPSLITGPLLGAWLDLTGRRRVLMIYDQLAISAGLAAILLLAGEAPDLLLPASALLLAGITYPLSFGGMTSFIPLLVPDGLLEPANAIEASSFNLALIIGPALAGTLSAAFGATAPLIVEIVLSLAALGLILLVPGLDRAGSAAHATGRSIWSVAGSGLTRIAEVPALRGVTATGVLGLGGLGLLTVAFPFFCVEHLGADRSAAGYLWAAFAFGSMVGALALVRLQRRLAPERLVVIGIAVFGALMLLWPLQSSLLGMLFVVALAGVADGPALAATFAARQQHVPPELHSQVFTTAAGLKVGAFALGSAVAGPVVLAAGSDGALLAAAVTQFVAAGAGALLMRTRRPAPALG
ncbi:MAG: MFS transporter [Thermoleophilaceae bacterium]|nr:MFS transporter [Thermoleophilaceae bacterium]